MLINRSTFKHFSGFSNIWKYKTKISALIVCTTIILLLFFFSCGNRFVTKYEPVILYMPSHQHKSARNSIHIYKPFINLLLLLLACGERWHRDSLKNIYNFMHINILWNVNITHKHSHTFSYSHIPTSITSQGSSEHVLLFNECAHLFTMHKTVHRNDKYVCCLLLKTFFLLFLPISPSHFSVSFFLQCGCAPVMINHSLRSHILIMHCI